jgi:hypothetical protein
VLERDLVGQGSAFVGSLAIEGWCERHDLCEDLGRARGCPASSLDRCRYVMATSWPPKIRPTCTADHAPPRAVRTTLALSAAAIPRLDVTLLAWICRMIGSTFAANASASRPKHELDPVGPRTWTTRRVEASLSQQPDRGSVVGPGLGEHLSRRQLGIGSDLVECSAQRL